MIPSLILLAIGAGLGRAVLWPIEQWDEERRIARAATEAEETARRALRGLL